MRRRLIAVLVMVLAAGACIIYVPEPADGGTGPGNGRSFHAQLLVMINLDPGVVNMADRYALLIAGYQKALSLQTPRVWIDQIAIAPLNLTTSGGARFIYSEQDPDPQDLAADGGINLNLNPPDNIDAGVPDGLDGGDNLDGGQPDGGALDAGLPQIANGTFLADLLSSAMTAQFLPADPNRGMQQNLADLGATITQQSVYQTNGANPDGVPAFTGPEDAFIVLTFDHLARTCAPTDANCLINGQTPMAYFGAADENGNAKWLNFGPGQGVPLKHVFHLPIFTQENIDSATFFARCHQESGFPQAFCDLIQPSPIAYYGPFTSAFSPGSNAIGEDFMDMFSSQAAYHVVLDTHQIVGLISN